MQPGVGTLSLTTPRPFDLIKVESRVGAHSLTSFRSFVGGRSEIPGWNTSFNDFSVVEVLQMSPRTERLVLRRPVRVE